MGSCGDAMMALRQRPTVHLETGALLLKSDTYGDRPANQRLARILRMLMRMGARPAWLSRGAAYVAPAALLVAAYALALQVIAPGVFSVSSVRAPPHAGRAAVELCGTAATDVAAAATRQQDGEGPHEATTCCCLAAVGGIVAVPSPAAATLDQRQVVARQGARIPAIAVALPTGRWRNAQPRAPPAPVA